MTETTDDPKKRSNTPDSDADGGSFDLGSLPEEFTPEVYAKIRIRDLERLDEIDPAHLTERQRQSLAARRAEAAEKFRAILRPRLSTTSLRVRSVFDGTDTLGKRLSDSLARTEKLAARVPPLAASVHEELLEAATTKQRGEADRWDRLHELTAAVADSTAILAERTEQQYQEAKRQRVMTWLLTYVAVVATVGTLVQIGLIASVWVLLGCLAVLTFLGFTTRGRGEHEH